MPSRTKNPSLGLAALEAYLNEPLRPGYVGGRRSGNLLINEYAANIPDTAEQEREAGVLDYQDDITRDYRAQENARLKQEEAARTAGFKSVADAGEYERGLNQLKSMIPLQVAAIQAEGQKAGRAAEAQRFVTQQALQDDRNYRTQEAQNERQFKAQQESRAKSVETGKTPVNVGGLKALLDWLPFVDYTTPARTAEATRIRGERYQPSPRQAGASSMLQAAQVLSQKYPDAAPEEMLALEGEDQMSPEEIAAFAAAVNHLRGN